MRDALEMWVEQQTRFFVPPARSTRLGKCWPFCGARRVAYTGNGHTAWDGGVHGAHDYLRGSEALTDDDRAWIADYWDGASDFMRQFMNATFDAWWANTSGNGLVTQSIKVAHSSTTLYRAIRLTPAPEETRRLVLPLSPSENHASSLCHKTTRARELALF